jgi:hypothetical protein
MKYFVAFLCIIALACTLPKDQCMSERTLPSKASLLSFTIVVDEINSRQDSTRLVLQLSNISGRMIEVSAPECFGVNIMPFAQDSANHDLVPLFLIKAFCKEVRKGLNPRDTLRTPFGYSMESCFRTIPGVVYQVHFEYRGNVYDENGKVICNETPLLSNILVLE